MKALLLSTPGPVSSLSIGEIPIPEPGPNEIRVKVHAVSLNPVDYKLSGRGNDNWAYPHVLGLDVAGTVDAIDPEVVQWQIGDRVFYHGDLTDLHTLKSGKTSLTPAA